MAEGTISAKNQIVIPREAREALGVKAGDKLLVIVRGGNVMIPRKPRPYQAAIHGLAGSRYPKGYLRREPRSWD